MNRDEKQAAVEEIGSELESSTAVFAIDYRGISVPQAAELRAKLRESDASFSVAQEPPRQARVTEGSDVAALDEHLVGPTALTFVRGDAVVAAKAIADFIKANGVLSYKGGLMDGDALAPEQFTAIAKLPGVESAARPARRARREPAERRRPDAEPAPRRPRPAARPGRRAGTGRRRGGGAGAGGQGDRRAGGGQRAAGGGGGGASRGRDDFRRRP